MSKTLERLKCGIVTENPTFVQMLGMCPTMLQHLQKMELEWDLPQR